MSVWIYLRHWTNWRILWAILTEFKTVGPFELDWATQQYKCWISQYVTFTLLACLQAVNLFWLFLILRIAKNYVFTTDPIGDERSDEEEEEDELESPTAGAKKALLESPKANGNKPVVLLNGEPVEGEPKAEGVRARKRKG